MVFYQHTLKAARRHRACVSAWKVCYYAIRAGQTGPQAIKAFEKPANAELKEIPDVSKYA